MKRSTVLLIVLIGLVGIAAAYALTSVNKIPTLDEQVVADWAQVQNQYQRRADLVPNLVETVKGFADQERNVLTAVTEARAKVSQIHLPDDITSDPAAFQAFEQAQAGLTSSLSRLLVTVERYPEVRSSQNFIALQAQLEGTENRIAVARRDYIDAVRRFNTEIRTFPGRLWHELLYADMGLKETFEANAGAAETPDVQFD